MIARDTGPPTDTRTCHVRCKVCLGDGRSQYGLGTLGFVTRSVRASYQATRCYHKCPPTKLCGRRPALRTAMLAIAAAAANLVAPELTISEDSSRILMISAREHRVYSRCASTLPTRGGWPSALCAVTLPRARMFRWDKINHRALSPYGRAMADAVRAHVLPSHQRPRVLMLGLGGGVIPGDILCNPGAEVAAITAVEAFPAVARLAEARFFPAMFSGACKPMSGRLAVVVGDALAGGLEAIEASGPRFSSILVDIPAAYEAAAGAPASFYSRLLGLGAPHASLVGYTCSACAPSMHTARTLPTCMRARTHTHAHTHARTARTHCTRAGGQHSLRGARRARDPRCDAACRRLAERDPESCGPAVRGGAST